MWGLGVHTDTNILTQYQIEGIIDILGTNLKIDCFFQQLQQPPEPLQQPPQLQQKPLQQPHVRNSTINFDQYRYLYKYSDLLSN